ncbi:MAG: PspA/IM30 family protein [Pseudomonadales bacterium]
MRVKQLVTSVTASFDQFVSKVENHEAVANHVMQDVQAAAARLRVQIRRIEADVERRVASRNRLRDDAERWQQRAVAAAQDEEARALECLERAERAREDSDIAQQQLERSEGLLAEVQSSLEDVESRLAELKHRRNTLSSRDTRADVLSTTQGGSVEEAAEAVFERWEQAVLEKEYQEVPITATGTDSFERAYDKAERTAALKSRLASLRAATGNSGERK